MARKAKIKHTSPAKDNSGEQVFSGNVDEILAEKIVSRTRQNTHAGNAEEQNREKKKTESPAPSRKQFRPLVVLAIVAGLLLLCIGLAGRTGRKRIRRR